jgi:hypothetical protein
MKRAALDHKEDAQQLGRLFFCVDPVVRRSLGYFLFWGAFTFGVPFKHENGAKK